MTRRLPGAEEALRAEAATLQLPEAVRAEALRDAATALERGLDDRVCYTITGSVLRGTALVPRRTEPLVVDALVLGAPPFATFDAPTCLVRILRAEPRFAAEGLRAHLPGLTTMKRLDPERQTRTLGAAQAVDPFTIHVIRLLKRWAREHRLVVPGYGLEALACWEALAYGPSPSLAASLARSLAPLAGEARLGLCFADAPGTMDPFDPAPHYLGCSSWRGTNTLAALRADGLQRIREAARATLRDLAPAPS